MEAVLVAMSCFRHLCEEADIRCGVDEVPVQTILPNYNTFVEFASVSNMMATGLGFLPNNRKYECKQSTAGKLPEEGSNSFVCVSFQVVQPYRSE